MKDKLIKAVKHPTKVLVYFLNLIGPMLSDATFIKLKFLLLVGYWPNLKNPKTYNEKLQWLKLHDRKPEYTVMVDKVKSKDYVAGIIGKEHIIPTLGVWEQPEDIDFDKLPNQFVLKCNHNSGKGMYICKDKSQVNKKEWKRVLKELRKGLKEDYYLKEREWPYKNVPRRILAEKFMVDESGTELKDYKYYCFDGNAQFMFIASGRGTGQKTFTYYDMDFNKLDVEWGDPVSSDFVARPETFNAMKVLAEKIAATLPQARIDFYDVNGRIYFGEITFFDGAGMTPFKPKSWDDKIGSMVQLPNYVGGGI